MLFCKCLCENEISLIHFLYRNPFPLSSSACFEFGSIFFLFSSESTRKMHSLPTFFDFIPSYLLSFVLFLIIVCDFFYFSLHFLIISFWIFSFGKREKLNKFQFSYVYACFFCVFVYQIHFPFVGFFLRLIFFFPFKIKLKYSKVWPGFFYSMILSICHNPVWVRNRKKNAHILSLFLSQSNFITVQCSGQFTRKMCVNIAPHWMCSRKIIVVCKHLSKSEKRMKNSIKEFLISINHIRSICSLKRLKMPMVGVYDIGYCQLMKWINLCKLQ